MTPCLRSANVSSETHLNIHSGGGKIAKLAQGRTERSEFASSLMLLRSSLTLSNSPSSVQGNMAINQRRKEGRKKERGEDVGLGVTFVEKRKMFTGGISYAVYLRRGGNGTGGRGEGRKINITRLLSFDLGECS